MILILGIQFPLQDCCCFRLASYHPDAEYSSSPGEVLLHALSDSNTNGKTQFCNKKFMLRTAKLNDESLRKPESAKIGHICAYAGTTFFYLVDNLSLAAPIDLTHEV